MCEQDTVRGDSSGVSEDEIVSFSLTYLTVSTQASLQTFLFRRSFLHYDVIPFFKKSKCQQHFNASSPVLWICINP